MFQKIDNQTHNYIDQLFDITSRKDWEKKDLAEVSKIIKNIEQEKKIPLTVKKEIIEWKKNRFERQKELCSICKCSIQNSQSIRRHIFKNDEKNKRFYHSQTVVFGKADGKVACRPA